MRIVIMANNIDELGGAQRVVHTLAAGFSHEHDVTLVGVTPHAARHRYGPDGVYSEHRLMDEAWPARVDDETARRRTRLREQAVQRLEALLADGEPGVIIVAQVWAMEVLADTVHSGWVVIGQYHGSFAAAATGRDLRRILKSYADVTTFLALTDEDARAFETCGLNNVRVMPNALASWPAALDPVAPAVGYLGRLSHEKGPDLLLHAWGSIAEAFPAWSLRVAGDGPMAEEIRQRARELPRVTVMDPFPDPEDFWRGVGVGVLPSRTEGLPMSLLEAQAAGIPCVATDCSSGVRALMPQVLTDFDGLAEGIASLMGDDVDRRGMGQRARANMADYRWDVVKSRWDRLLARAVS